MRPQNSQLPTDLVKKVKEIADNIGYEKCVIEHKKVSTDFGNFLAILYEIDLKGETKNGHEVTYLFVKYTLPAEGPRLVDMKGVYKTETFAYSVVLKLYQKMQEEAQISKEKRLNTPKYYGGSLEYIILENLNKKGFRSPHRTDIISWESAKLSIEQLAKFHALSFVLQRKNPEFFDSEIKSLRYPVKFNNKYYEMFKNCIEISVQKESDARKTHIEGQMEKWYKYYEDCFSSVTDTCCLCHGDYRPNNILFKEKNEIVQEVKPIDFQTMLYGSPLTDLMYFIFLATDHQFRKSHLQDMKDLYFGHFELFLGYFNIDVESVYPRRVFEKEFKEKLYFGLPLSMFIMQFLHMDENDMPDPDSTDFSELKFTKVKDLTVERVRGVLDEFQEWGLLSVT